MNPRVPWHPFVLAAVIVVTAWLDAAVSPYAAMRSLVVAVALAGSLTAIAGLLARSVQVGALFATGVIGVLWSRQLVIFVVEVGSRMGAFVIVWGVLLIALVFVGVRVIRRASRRLTVASATQTLNRASVLLMVAAVLLGLVNGRLAAVVDDLGQGVPLAEWPSRAGEPASSPDIYVILLDGYPRADVLDYAFDIDNSAFLSALGARGFDVATASHSDYLWTHVSVPSALNLAYVEQIPTMVEVIEGDAPRQPTLRTTVADNAAFDLAREHGYTPAAVGSGFEEVAPRLADVYVDGGQLNEFEVSVLVSTFVGDLVAVAAPDFASAQQRDRIASNLAVLADIAAIRDRDPTLVFAHVPAPHQPVVFGADGAPVAVPISDTFYADSPPERGEDPEEYRERYRAQMPYLNDLILDSIDGVLDASEEPPVIVLFADHGSASVVDWNTTQPENADPARLLERTGTLFAALTPNRGDIFPDDVSPVDIYRLLLDAYFGTELGRADPPPDGGQIPPVDAAVLDD